MRLTVRSMREGEYFHGDGYPEYSWEDGSE